MIDLIKHIVFNYNKVIFLAPNDITKLLNQYKLFEIDAIAIDYDPKFLNKEFYINKDFVFDNVNLNAELIIHMNVEKTYPISLPKNTDVVLVGDDENHNGDCTFIDSCEKIIKLYNIKKIYKQEWIKSKKKNHYYVYGQV